MKLYLIRHGQSIGNTKPGFISGRSDPEGLSVAGKSQMIRTAWNLKQANIDLDYILSSPVARAKESAEMLGYLLNKSVRIEPFLQEFDYGVFERNYWWVQNEKNRKAWQKTMEDFSHAIPGGDSYQTFSDNLWRGYESFLSTIDRNAPSNLALVTHNVVVSTLLFSILYGHPSHTEATSSYKKAYIRFINSFRVPNGSVTVIDLKADPILFETVTFGNDPIPVTQETISFYLSGMWKSEVVAITKQHTASENKVFHVQGDKNGILKLIEEREVVTSERIVEIYTYLHENTEIPVPKVLFYDKSSAFFTESVMMQDFLEGTNQADFIREHPELADRTIDHVYAILKKIHTIPVEDVEAFWYPDDVSPYKVHVPWHVYICGEIQETLKALPSTPLSKTVKTRATKMLENLFEYAKSRNYKEVPIHGDLSPQNIIVAIKDEACYFGRVLDFERARIGDPLWDLAYYWGWIDRDAPEQLVEYWRATIVHDYTARQQEIIEWYRVLFHCWTVHDIQDYKGCNLRSQRAESSIHWLEHHLS
jgi:probable phosphoglycerate mutase